MLGHAPVKAFPHQPGQIMRQTHRTTGRTRERGGKALFSTGFLYPGF
jgi:hypothetical protein